MKVVILGCGRMGALLASRLSDEGHTVSIIDQDSTQFSRLSPDYRGSKVVGNGTEQDTLRRAGIEVADVFVAITQGDNRNIMASELSRVIFEVPRVYTRVKDPLRADAYEQVGLRTFCTTLLASSRVGKMIAQDDTLSRTAVDGGPAVPGASAAQVDADRRSLEA